ncbi:MAG: phage integrase SAM-like domain-containing protein, partial [Bacteroidales bacterium]|nr:phage integrase SAM-like domain-containing protein [Bacteroidales bacterium]
MAVNYFLEKRANKEGELPIRAQICVKGVTRISTFGISIDPDVWDGNRVSKGTYRNSKRLTGAEINKRLNNIENHFMDWDNELTHRPTKDEIKEQLDKALNKEETTPPAKAKKARKKTFFQMLDEFTAEQGAVQQWAYATNQCWLTFKHHMENFKPDVTFEFFDETGLNKFVTYLRKDKGLEDNSVRKQYKNLLWFTNWALRKEYTRQNTITRYKPKFKVVEKPIIFLDRDELNTLYNYEIPKNGTKVKLLDMNGNEYEKVVQEAGALAKARDLFCFCAFTSLRFSDMYNLRKKDVAENYIYVTTQKTNDRLPIDLNPYSKAILDKYKDLQTVGDHALPVISNQKMNDYLKDLGELCGFNDPITRVCFRAGQ